jgi:hypothetical protein
MKNAAFLVLLALLFTHTASADPYTLTFTSTVTDSGSLPAGVNVGDSFEMFVVVDNGGSTEINQTWGYADILSVDFSINGGSYTANFPGATFIPFDTVGDIQTDGAGMVTSSVTEWGAETHAGNLDSNGNELDEWIIIGLNPIVITVAGFEIDAAGATTTANLWAVSAFVMPPAPASNAIPTISIYGLILTTLGLLLVATRRLRVSTKGN